MRKNWKGLSIGVAAFLMAATWSVAEAADKIKVGAIVAATGPASFLGDPELKTLEHYVAKINQAGGVNGQQIELVAYDSGGDAKKAVTFAKRLLSEDKVAAIIGPSSTGETMAVIPFVEKEQIPLLSMAGGIDIVQPVKENVFKIVATDRMACERIMQDMKARGFATIGMISGTDGFGKSMREQCLDVSKNFGITVAADETYGPKDVDMNAQLTKVKNTAGIQAVLNPGFGQGPAIVTKNYRDLGLAFPFYQSHGVASKKFIEIADPAAEGVRLVSPPVVVAEKLDDSVANKAVALAYKQEFEKVTGTEVASFGGHAHSALFALVEAIKISGKSDAKSIRDELEQLKNHKAVDGVITMSKTDHLGIDTHSGMVLLEIKNGD